MQHATCSTYSTKRTYACRAGSSEPSPSVRVWTQFGSTDIRSVCVLIGPACAVFAAVARKRTPSHSLTVASHSLIMTVHESERRNAAIYSPDKHYSAHPVGIAAWHTCDHCAKRELQCSPSKCGDSAPPVCRPIPHQSRIRLQATAQSRLGPVPLRPCPTCTSHASDCRQTKRKPNANQTQTRCAIPRCSFSA